MRRSPAHRVGAWAALLLAPVLLANGGTLRVADARMGSYRVSVYTDPTPARPDSLDVSVLVLGADDPTPVPGLDVRVTARLLRPREEGSAPPGAATLERTADRRQADDPRYYAAKFAPGVAGEWRIEVSVEGPGGAGRVDFLLDVREPGPLDRPWVVLSLALVPLALLGWWLTRASGPGVAAGGDSRGDGVSSADVQR